MSDNAHAFLAPSSAHIWGPGGCPYYPTMAASHPQTEDSPESREGTAAHHLVAERLSGVWGMEHGTDPAGTPLTEEMFECTNDFVRDVETLRRNYPDLEECIEERVHMPMVHAKLNWGTADWFAISRSAKRIWVKDFKYGHRYVDAWENWQLADYLLGVINHFMITDAKEWTADLGIYQPRSFHADGPNKSWEVGGHRFVDLSAALASAAAEATGPVPKMRTGGYCGDCEGRTSCPAFTQSTQNGIDLSLKGMPHDMDAAARGTFRTQIAAALKRLNGMATGLDAEIETDARAGKVTPGWELQPGQSRLDWTVSMGEVYTLGLMMEVATMKTEDFGGTLVTYDVLTPTQAIKAGIDEAVIMEYAKRRPAALKVVQSSTHSAAKAFS